MSRIFTRPLSLFLSIFSLALSAGARPTSRSILALASNSTAASEPEKTGGDPSATSKKINPQKLIAILVPSLTFLTVVPCLLYIKDEYYDRRLEEWKKTHEDKLRKELDEYERHGRSVANIEGSGKLEAEEKEALIKECLKREEGRPKYWDEVWIQTKLFFCKRAPKGIWIFFLFFISCCGVFDCCKPDY